MADCRPKKYGYGTPPEVQKIAFADPTRIDAFGRVRVSEPEAVFDFKRNSDEYVPIFYSSQVTGSGSVSLLTSSAECRLTISGTSGDKVIQQTKQYFTYQPAKSSIMFATFNFSGSTTSVTKKVGVFDDNNGLFFELSGSILSVVRRSSTTGNAVDTKVSQSAWNIDPLDGTGPSRYVFSSSMAQIGVIDFEWLGVGKIRYGFVVDGSIRYCHSEDFANKQTGVWSNNPSLPFRCEIEALEATTSSSFASHCQSVASEGGHAPVKIERSADRGLTARSITTTLLPVISIRLKSDQFQSVVRPIGMNILPAGGANVDYRWALYLNPTITGGSAASWVDVNNSSVQYDITRTGTVSAGHVIASGYGIRDSAISVDFDSLLGLGSHIDGTPDEFVVAVQTISAGSTNFYGSIRWEEFL